MEKHNNKKLISEMREALNNKRKGVLESIIFDEGTYDNEMDNPGYDGDMDMDDFDFDTENTKNTNSQTVKTPEIKSVINNIRKQALQGIQQIADDPTSAEYDTLKKIWQLCDKAVDMKQPEMTK